MPPHRRKPFSAKQKKKQLQNKRKKNRDDDGEGEKVFSVRQDADSSAESSQDENSEKDVKKLAHQAEAGGRQGKRYDPNRYRLHFLKESREEIERRKAKARVPLPFLPEDALETDLDDVYRPGSVLDIPKRPPWNYSLSKHTLLSREEHYFRQYMENIFEKYGYDELSYIELNLETWRQLWRVLEMSDIVLLITDIRHPALHFAPTLYDYVTKELKKHIILILNKIDLAPPSVVAAWKQYFQQRFPQVHIICFTSFPKDSSKLPDRPGKMLRKRKMVPCSPVGPSHLLKACEQIIQGQVDLENWKEKIQEDLAVSFAQDEEQHAETEIKVEDVDATYAEHVQYKDGILTIGCCGYPNVGKSSVINALVGKKVVSVSRTPGHTKHFQTIFLTNTVKLCDCPGLVFPSLVSKPMQILAGMYPIAQVAEPYTTVGYLGQRLPLPKLLKIKHPELDEFKSKKSNVEWSAYEICDAWAEKRGFLTAKAARNDTYRAANSILRLALEGRLCLCSTPPGFTTHKDYWESHPDTQEIALNQKSAAPPVEDDADEEDVDSDNEKDVNEAELLDRGDRHDDDEDTGSIGMSNPFALLGGDD